MAITHGAYALHVTACVSNTSCPAEGISTRYFRIPISPSALSSSLIKVQDDVSSATHVALKIIAQIKFIFASIHTSARLPSDWLLCTLTQRVELMAKIDPRPAAPCIHPPRESAGRQTRNARTGLGPAVRGGEPASLRAGERVRDVGRNRFELGSIKSPQ
jgi:hypothetical protein